VQVIDTIDKRETETAWSVALAMPLVHVPK
jgi:hypothetical protein